MVPHWKWILLGILLSLLSLLANIGLLTLSSWFIAAMAIAGVTGTGLDITVPSAGVRALALGRTGGRYAERLVNHNVTFKLLAALRVWFYERLEPLAPARLSSFRSGDLLSRIRSDVDTLDDFYVRAFVPIVVALLAAVLIALFIAGYSPLLALLDLAFLAAGGALIPLLLRAVGERPGRESVQLSADLRAQVVEEVQGMGELIAFGALDRHAARTGVLTDELIERQRRLNAVDGAADSGLVVASALGMWSGAIVLIPLVVSGRLPAADLPMLTVLMLASFEAVMPLPSVFGRLGEMAAAARRLFEIIDAQPPVRGGTEEVFAARPSSGSAAEPSVSSITRARGPSAPAVTCAPLASVESLRFRYEPSGRWIIDGLSLRLVPGRIVALVGPTGAGKSSLINVLMRFWEYEGGRIELAGRDLRSFTLDAARSWFSVAPQNTYLFHSTVRENLLVGDGPDFGAAMSAENRSATGGSVEAATEASSVQEAIAAALRAAALVELVAELPDGLESVVGETGLRLSAGQARRLVVARALLKPAPILILDEPTEGLDDATAGRMLGAVVAHAAARAILIISHRPRDLAFADERVELALRR